MVPPPPLPPPAVHQYGLQFATLYQAAFALHREALVISPRQVKMLVPQQAGSRAQQSKQGRLAPAWNPRYLGGSRRQVSSSRSSKATE